MGSYTPIRVTPEMEDRFWSKVQRHPTDCWEWTAAIHKKSGYGWFGIGESRSMNAHRVAYALAYGKHPKELHVLHSCDNRRCVRPSHLWLGTDADNVRDMMDKDRGGKKLNFKTVRQIKFLLEYGAERKVIADYFGVDRANVDYIAQGKIWENV